MKSELKRWGVIALTILGVFAVPNAISSRAQEKGEPVVIERERIAQGPDMPLPAPPPGDFIFLATEMSFGGKVVKGAPYSAQAIKESTQTLSDGNRILNKSTAAVYRDSEGRTRREETLRAIGPMAKSGEPRQMIFINDPVAGTSYHLDPQEHIAFKMPPMRFKFEKKLPPPEGSVGVKHGDPEEFSIEIAPDVMIHKKGTALNGAISGEPGPGVIMHKKMTEAGVAMGWIGTRNENAKTESLGKQNIEGIEAEGTRTTVTIPAGEIGNERAIEVVNERWYSQQLQTVVMSRHSDPRFGENTYRLTNISLTEPARSLFEVPADYVVTEKPMHKPIHKSETMRMRKPTNQ